MPRAARRNGWCQVVIRPSTDRCQVVIRHSTPDATANNVIAPPGHQELDRPPDPSESAGSVFYGQDQASEPIIDCLALLTVREGGQVAQQALGPVDRDDLVGLHPVGYGIPGRIGDP
jgi:hypothetical protein